jgi:pimeloyl-ACP methyl ester carboxylesterase
MRWLFLFFLVTYITCYSQKEKVYLLPGQGADYRLFSKLQIDSSRFDTIHIKYPEPVKKETMKQFAQRLIQQIDTCGEFYLIGTSLGGMLACEISEIKEPKGLILISSAKNKEELPFRYRFQKFIPVYRTISGNTLLWGAKKLQPLVEPDSKNNKEIFESMLEKKSAHYMKWTIHMICTWDKSSPPRNCLHIHGEKDKTIPIRRVKNPVLIENGSHMITLTRGEEVSAIINGYLKQIIDEL